MTLKTELKRTIGHRVECYWGTREKVEAWEPADGTDMLHPIGKFDVHDVVLSESRVPTSISASYDWLSPWVLWNGGVWIGEPQGIAIRQDVLTPADEQFDCAVKLLSTDSDFIYGLLLLLGNTLAEVRSFSETESLQ